MNYFIFQPDPRVPEQPSVLSCPPDIAPEEFLKGKHMTVPRNPLHLKMSARSGKFRGGIITGVLTLFHNRLCDELKKIGVDNIEYFPVDLETPEGQIEQKYQLINIVGLVDAVDPANSEIEPVFEGGRGDVKSFKIDPEKARGLRMFRIPEAPTLIIVDETVNAALEKLKPPGAWTIATEEYDGW